MIDRLSDALVGLLIATFCAAVATVVLAAAAGGAPIPPPKPCTHAAVIGKWVMECGSEKFDAEFKRDGTWRAVLQYDSKARVPDEPLKEMHGTWRVKDRYLEVTFEKDRYSSPNFAWYFAPHRDTVSLLPRTKRNTGHYDYILDRPWKRSKKSAALLDRHVSGRSNTRP